MSGVLHSREANPEQVLKNLGFAGSEVLTRIPDRFLKQQSQVTGISYFKEMCASFYHRQKESP